MSSQDPFERFLSGLDKVKRRGSDRAEALCPAHTDKKKSFSISRGDKGQVVFYCHEVPQCSFEDILKARGLSIVDLYPPQEPGQPIQAAEAWTKATENHPLAKYFLGQFMQEGYRSGKATYKAPWELQNQMNQGFLNATEVWEILEGNAFEGLYRACVYHNPPKRTLAQYAAPIIGKELVEAAYRLVPEAKTGGWRRETPSDKGSKDRNWEDPSGDEVAEKLDAEAGEQSDKARILLSIASESSGLTESPAPTKAGDKPKASNNNGFKGSRGFQTSPVHRATGRLKEQLEALDLSSESAQEIRETLAQIEADAEATERLGIRRAQVKFLIAAARDKKAKSTDPEEQRSLGAAIRKGCRDLERLETH